MDASNVSWFEADWSRDELEVSWRQLEQLETPQTLSLSIKRLTKLRNIHLKRTNFKKILTSKSAYTISWNRHTIGI